MGVTHCNYDGKTICWVSKLVHFLFDLSILWTGVTTFDKIISSTQFWQLIGKNCLLYGGSTYVTLSQYDVIYDIINVVAEDSSKIRFGQPAVNGEDDGSTAEKRFSDRYSERFSTE